MLDSVRNRLTLWYVAVLSLVLLAFVFLVYGLLASNLQRRTDASVHAALDSMKHLLGYERAEGDTELEAARNTVAELRYPNTALAVFTADGTLLAEVVAGNLHATLPVSPREITDTAQLWNIDDGSGSDDDASRVGAQRVQAMANAAPNLIVVRQTLGQINGELASLRQVLAIAAPLALILAGLGGWFLARKALAPVVAMSDRARRIGADNLDERLPVVNPRDELGQLASTFNELLARLNLAFDQQRQFMADASHELRTPLSVIRTTSQVILERGHRPEREYRDAFALMDAQTMRLSRIVSDMFTLARADSGHRPLHPSDFYFDELVQETVTAAEVLGRRKHVSVELQSNAESLCYGDQELLRQMLLNLLDNAIKHTAENGRIVVALSRSDERAVLRISDTGSGIPIEAQPYIFERFFRADESRSRDSDDHGTNGHGGGAGLGLSIARWVAQAHRGSLELVESNAGGTTFRVEVPLKSYS